MNHFRKAKAAVSDLAQSAYSTANASLSTAQASWAADRPLTARWTKVAVPSLPRSSHTVSVVGGRAYIFGGEIEPRSPVDNDMHIIILPQGEFLGADYRKVPARPAERDGPVPEKRVGHSAAVIEERIFIFGGRGGEDMQPLEEHGRVWVYDTRTDSWSYIDPEVGTSYPEARSYHCSTAIEEPTFKGESPQYVTGRGGESIPGNLAKDARDDAQRGGHGTFFVHAGCPVSGRLNDVWAFDVRRRTWTELPAAPGQPRGGTSITAAHGKIYRYGGFNGTDEEGGRLDILDLGLPPAYTLPKGIPKSLGDISKLAAGGPTDQGVYPRACRWETIDFLQNNVPVPGKRSVAALHRASIGAGGRQYLLVLYGERDPSSQGHAGAGKFWDDVWAYQIPSAKLSATGVKDAAFKMLRQETGDGVWREVRTAGEIDEAGVVGPSPSPRGWFASAPLGDLNNEAVFLWGGLNSENQREGDGWILKFE